MTENIAQSGNTVRTDSMTDSTSLHDCFLNFKADLCPQTLTRLAAYYQRYW